jgi:uncharacterized membrane protein YqhA
MDLIEKAFEGMLWRSRWVVLFAVLASMAASFAIFYMATVDVFYLVSHILHYADASLTGEARKLLHDETITHVVEVVDGYLLATVMLIFGLGMYELFISPIDEAQDNESSSAILLIHSLDDLKQRLAKVIIMIMIVTIFELALKLHVSSALDLLYLAGAVALIGLALYLTHAADGHSAPAGKAH